MRDRPASIIACLVVTLAMLAVLAVPAFAQTATPAPDLATVLRDTRVLEVHHGPVEVALVDETSDGHQLGDLRVASIATTDRTGQPLGRLDATLTTVAVDTPSVGDEIRESTLVFTFGEDGRDQVVVNGAAVYPAQGATLAVGEPTVRPIVGGSGRFSAASGSALSEHRSDGTWVHYLGLDLRRGGQADRRDAVRPGRGAGRGPAPRLRERLRERWTECLGGRHDDDPARWEREGDRSPCGLLRVRRRGSATREGSSAATEAIVRDDLGLVEPGSAPGQELGLWTYRIPAGSALEPHTHAGWQLAHIAQGTLEYTVLSGEGTLVRADGSREAIGPGTYLLGPGDGVIEDPDLEHFGVNRGRGDVVILAATLYPAGAPLSIPVGASPEPAAAPSLAAASAAPAHDPDVSPEPIAEPVG